MPESSVPGGAPQAAPLHPTRTGGSCGDPGVSGDLLRRLTDPLLPGTGDPAVNRRKEGHAVNQITLTGTVATEPMPRPGLDQPAVAFRLAVPRDDSSEPLHVDVICTRRRAGFAFALVPGDHLGVAGRLDHHEWVADDGIRRARWVVIAREVIVLRNAKRAA